MRAELKAVPRSQPNSSGESPARSFQLTQALRLPAAADFSYVFADAVAVHNRSFTFLSRDSKQKVSRLGLVISKKNAGRAVDRNRLKRIIKESFRHHHIQLPKVDIVVLAKKGADKKDNKKLFQDLSSGWQQLTNKHTS